MLRPPGGNRDLGLGVAVGRRVFQNVAEDPRQLLRVAPDRQVLVHPQNHPVAPFRQQRRHLVRQLHQQVVEVHRLLGQGDLLGVIPGDFKKFIHHRFQPVGFVQSDAHPLGPLLRRAVRLLLQEIQVTDDRGQRRSDVVGQIHDQLVLPPLRLGGFLFPLRQGPLDGVELALEGQHLRREADLLPVVRQQGLNPPVDLAKVTAHTPEDPPQHESKDQEYRAAEKEILVEAEVIGVKIKGLLAAHVQDMDQKPDDHIPHPPFPEQPVQGGDNENRQRHAAADPPGKLGVKDRILVPIRSLQFYIPLPIPF